MTVVTLTAEDIVGSYRLDLYNFVWDQFARDS
jgi:hypothetical protein